MFAIVAPGQGAQKQGFLAPWLELDEFASALAALSREVDLAHFGAHADDETIRDTAIAQPLLVGSALAVAEVFAEPADVVAGHSVGELAAMALAGVISRQEAMRLVNVRGRAMAQASALQPTSMTAIIGGKVDEVLAAVEAADLTSANHNGAGQIVAAGTLTQLEALAAHPPARARLIPLSVAGAFHTIHMASAVDALGEAAATITPANPTTGLLSNKDGARVTSGEDALQRLVQQVANPVRWDLCMATLAELGVTGLLELTPAGTLTGIAKRNLKGVELFSLNTPDQLDDARAFAAAHRKA